MSELDLPKCPICHAVDSLTRETLARAGQPFTWYECQECGSVLLWIGDDQWAYQKVGREEKAYLLKRPMTVSELQALLPQVEEARPSTSISGDVSRRMPDQGRKKSTASRLIPWMLALCLIGFLALVAIVLYQQASDVPLLARATSKPTNTVGPTSTLRPTRTPRPTPTPPCTGPELDEFIGDFEALVERWDDTTQLAGSTGRIALSPIVAEMQEIRREVKELNGPWCVEETRSLTMEYMDEFIDGYLAFMAQESDSEVSSRFETAKEKMDKAIVAWLELELLAGAEE
jgi:hypothetical protein